MNYEGIPVQMIIACTVLGAILLFGLFKLFTDKEK
jgi:hypothetical protein